MALVRCMHHGRPKAPRYVEEPYLPYAGLGSAICGRGLCFEVGFVWLTRLEAGEYVDHDRRVFLFPSSGAKIAVGKMLTLAGAERHAAEWAKPRFDDFTVRHDGLTPAGPPMRLDTSSKGANETSAEKGSRGRRGLGRDALIAFGRW